MNSRWVLARGIWRSRTAMKGIRGVLPAFHSRSRTTPTRFAQGGCGDPVGWAQRARERGNGRGRAGEGGGILSVNRNDNLAIDPLRERASRLIRTGVHLVVLALRLPEVANRERSYCSPGCLAMTVSVNREPRRNPATEWRALRLTRSQRRSLRLNARKRDSRNVKR